MKDRIETLKEYLKRLGDGEPLEAVRKDFVEVFKDVDPAEIMKAEQEILAEGTPLSDVQKLCDVHAALFHGKTREEQIANAEKAVHASALREERESKTRELAQIKGHPLWLFANENGALAMLLEQAEEKIKDGSANKKTLESLRGISIHYAKKGDLLYPVLNVRYGISGPASVMWTVDDEIRDEISFLAKMNDKESEWQERFATVVARAQEVIYKRQIFCSQTVRRISRRKSGSVSTMTRRIMQCVLVWNRRSGRRQRTINMCRRRRSQRRKSACRADI